MAFISNKKQLLMNIGSEINYNYVSHGKPTFFRYTECMVIVFFFNNFQIIEYRNSKNYSKFLKFTHL